MKKTTVFFLCAALLVAVSCGNNSGNKKSGKSGEAKTAAAATKSPKASVEAVDLGLSVKWANCNLGAKSEWEIGDYFAWGEVQPKANYSADSYKHRDANGNWIKYAFYADAIVDADVAKADNQATLLPEDDAATAILGDGWSIPTPEQVQELMDKCEIKYWEQGIQLVGPNGNNICIPYGGSKQGDKVRGANQTSYWTNQLYSQKGKNVLGGEEIVYVEQYARRFDVKGKTIGMEYRYNGLPIRAVKK